MGFVYLLRFPNGKGYVGQTRRKKVTDRWRAHKNRTKGGCCRKLGNAIRKYGWACVQKSILETVENNKLNERERHWIAKLKTFKQGYNLTEGGDENPMLRQSVRDQLKKTLSNPDAKKRISKRWKDYHADPVLHAKWLEKHNAAHRTPAVSAKITANNKKAWAKPGAKTARGNAIRKALNTKEMKATRDDRVERMKATKRAKFEAKLSALPPAEAARKRKEAEQRARRRAKRVPGRSTPPPENREWMIPSDYDSE